MKKINFFSLIAITLLSLAAVAPVRAEDSTATKSDTTTMHRDAESAFTKLGDSRDHKLASCTVVETKVKARVNHDNSLESAHSQQYSKLVTRLTDLISRAKAAGYDTTDLEANLATLKDKIATFTTDKAAYIAALKTSQTYVCGKSEGEFKDAIVGARTELAAVFADAKDIESYVKETIKPTVLALKKELAPTASPTSTETPDTTQ